MAAVKKLPPAGGFEEWRQYEAARRWIARHRPRTRKQLLDLVRMNEDHHGLTTTQAVILVHEQNRGPRALHRLLRIQ